MIKRMTYGYATAVPMLTATKQQPGRYARRSAQTSEPMRATRTSTPTDRVAGSATVRRLGRPRREAHRRQPPVHLGLEPLKLRAVPDSVIPAIVPMPRERAVVAVRAAGGPLEGLESRIGLPLGVEERRRKDRDGCPAIHRAAKILPPPVELVRRQLDH